MIGETTPETVPEPVDSTPGALAPAKPRPPSKDGQAVEIGGRAGPDPIRYGDWEKNGRCIDF
jgi:hypothetical protein